MSEHHIAVERTARYFTVGSVSAATREVWLVLHGYGQLAEHFIRSFRSLDDGTRLIVAPEALSRFYRDGTRGHVGASWMTSVDRLAEIDDYVRYLDVLVSHVFDPIDRTQVRLVVLGFSQGASTATRWACHGAWPADAVVLWGSSVAPDVEPEVARDRLDGLYLVLGSHDEYRDEVAVVSERERLKAAGIPFVPVSYDGTHRILPDPLERVAAMIGATPAPIAP